MAEEQAAEIAQLKQGQEQMLAEIAKMRDMMAAMMEKQSATVLPGSQGLEGLPIQAASASISVPPVFTMPIPPLPTFTNPIPTVPMSSPGILISSGPSNLSSGVAATNPVMIPNLDDPVEQEKLKKLSEEVKDPEAQQKLDLLEERLRAIEGIDIFGTFDVKEISLVPGLVLPPKFRPPEFEKFSGGSCPRTHLIKYCRKMAGYANNEKLMIHCFQDSLSGSAATWYSQLEPSKIHSWVDLARAFIAQYRHVADTAPDRISLMTMEKKPAESFKEYAQRWRDAACQVKPPLSEKETIMLFVTTLKPPYYDRMVGNGATNFADMVVAGEMIEGGIKSGKIVGEESSSNKRVIPAKKKEEVHQVSTTTTPHPIYPSYYSPPYPYPYVNNVAPYSYPSRLSQQPRPTASTVAPRPATTSANNNTFQKNREPIDPIPMPYTQLLPILFEKNLLVPVHIKPLKPPYPKWYNPNAHCAYHAGIAGHDTENCTALKYRVQGLIRTGQFGFIDKSDANISQNPLPNHGGATVGMVSFEEQIEVKKKVYDIKILLKMVFEVLIEADMIVPEKFNEKCLGLDEDASCLYHSGTRGHDIQDCHEFRRKLQKMMSSNMVQFCTKKLEKEVAMAGYEGLPLDAMNIFQGPSASQMPDSTTLIPKPLTTETKAESSTQNLLPVKPKFLIPIPMTKNEPAVTETSKSKPQILIPIPKPMTTAPKPFLLIEVPKPFAYKDNKAVPWSYDFKVVSGNEESSANISGIGGMTRSGRCYTPEMLAAARKQKAKEDETGPLEKKYSDGKNEEVEKGENILGKEEDEFLKFIKHSEYSIVEQLNKTPARISMLSLLMSSEAHKMALLKMLNQAYVSPNISVDNLDHIMGNMVASNAITFCDDEIPLNGRGSTKALYITVRCKNFDLANVLIDNGASLNIMPMSTLLKLPVDASHIRNSNIMVRAFDGTRRDVIGDIEIPIQVGPCVFNILFQVMDIIPSYSCLLGRSWIHSAGAVPSSLHQKIKFIINNQLVTVSAEKEILVQRCPTPYVEADERAVQCSFRSFEVADITYILEGSALPTPRLSNSTLMSTCQTVGRGCRAGFGLGKDLQGMTQPVQIFKMEGRTGLGYKSTKNERAEMRREQKVKRLAGQGEGNLVTKKMHFPPLCETFVSAGIIYPDQQVELVKDGLNNLTIHMVSKESGTEYNDRVWVTPSIPGQELKNWTITELPVILNPIEK